MTNSDFHENILDSLLFKYCEKKKELKKEKKKRNYSVQGIVSVHATPVSSNV